MRRRPSGPAHRNGQAPAPLRAHCAGMRACSGRGRGQPPRPRPARPPRVGGPGAAQWRQRPRALRARRLPQLARCSSESARVRLHWQTPRGNHRRSKLQHQFAARAELLFRSISPILAEYSGGGRQRRLLLRIGPNLRQSRRASAVEIQTFKAFRESGSAADARIASAVASTSAYALSSHATWSAEPSSTTVGLAPK